MQKYGPGVVRTALVSLLLGAVSLPVAVLWPRTSQAAGACATVSVTSASAGQPIVARLDSGAQIQVHTDATVEVCFMRADGNCATALTTGHGICYPAGQGWEYIYADRWQGQLCGRLKSGSTPVNIEVCSW